VTDGRGPIVGVILAGGSSSRLGRPKQLLPLGDRPVLAHTLAHARAAALDKVIVVLGHEAATAQERIDFTGAQVVVNPDYREGQSTSLRAGLAALPPDTDAALFILGDQPLIGAAVHDALIAARRATGAPIVMLTYAGVRGNPVLIASELFPELAQVTGDQGARGVIRAHKDAVHEVPIPGPPLTDDLDTEEDYARLLARYAALAENGQ
jgi:molybdenum cofactor cytidylyltransferase